MSKLKLFLVFFANLSQFTQIHCEFANTKKFIYHAYQNSLYCNPSTNEILKPGSQAEVLEIVRSAINQGLTVKAVGSKHSITDIICTNGVPIEMKKLTNMRMDENNEIVTVEAGTTLEALGKYLHDKGRALLHMPTFMGITIGGAIGTGAHGSSLKHPSSISDYVVGVKIIDGLGQIQYIADPKELRAFMVHLGLLGIILEIQLTTVPQYKVRKTHKPAHDSILSEIDENGQPKILEMAKKHDFFELFWFPSFKQVIIGSGDYVSVNVSGDAHTNFIPKLSRPLLKLVGAASELVQMSRSYELGDMVEYVMKRSLVRPIIGRPHIFEEKGRFAGWPAIGYSYKMMASNCEGDECLWGETGKVYNYDTSFSMDLAKFTAIIKNLRDIQRKVIGDYALLGIYIRFSLQHKALMSKGFDRDLVHIEWVSLMRKIPYQNPRLGLSAYQTMGLSLMKNFDGRAHWGKNGPYFHSRENIFACYCKHYQQFTSAMAKYDPNGLFHNKFANRVLRKSNARDTDPIDFDYNKEGYHCALLDACEWGGCAKNEDCAKTEDKNVYPQTCDTVELDNEDQNLNQSQFRVCRDVEQRFIDYGPLRENYHRLHNYTLLLVNIVEFLTNNIEDTISTVLPFFK